MSQEQTLLDDLKTYEQTLQSSVMTISNSTEQTEAIVASVAEVAASVIFPGVGSLAVAAIFAGIRLASGRTFESDNYYGALLFLYAVQGQNITDVSKVQDNDVLGALQWFEDKTGVFISGREHIYALQTGAAKYMSYYGVNSYTTQDLVRVNLAVGVVQRYMKGQGTSMPPGSWAATVGVYDNAATAAEVAARLNDPTAESDTTGADSVGVGMTLASGASQVWTNLTTGMKAVVLAVLGLLLYFIYKLVKSK